MSRSSDSEDLADGASSLSSRFMEKYGVPAVGTALLSTKREPTFLVLGTRCRDKDDPVRLGDQWHIGSCAKAVTAALFARLVERGDAQWGMPVPALFPDFAGVIAQGWRERTVDELFHCRSGFPANLGEREMADAWASTGDLAKQRTQVAQAALSKAPGPKGRFCYSNLGYIVIGAAIDRLAGKPYEAAIEELLLSPLGVTSGGFGPPPAIMGHPGRFRLGPLILGRGSAADPLKPESDNPAVMNSAGRLHLTLPDWARLQRLFMAGAPNILRADTVEHLLRVPSGAGVPMAMGWASARNLGEAFLGMQGSNTLWSACAVMDKPRQRMALVVCNDGRSRVLEAEPRLADDLLRLVR